MQYDEVRYYYDIPASDIDRVYVEKVLPARMYFNLKSIEQFSLLKDCYAYLTIFFLSVVGYCCNWFYIHDTGSFSSSETATTSSRGKSSGCSSSFCLTR